MSPKGTLKIDEELEMTKTVEWRTLFLMVCCYGLWIAAGLLWLTPYWLIGLIALPVLAAFHTSLQHETIHGHPTPFHRLNELLVSLPLGAVFPFRRYRDLHLKHHNDMNLTDPYEDPESYFWPLCEYSTMQPIMRLIFRINNTLMGRFTIGPALTIWGFSRTELRRLRIKEPGVALAWVLHLMGLFLVALIVVMLFEMPLWVYALFCVYPALSLTSLRSYAEHQAAENVGARSAIVEAHPALALLYLNNNLHIVHHANPSLPWYSLPALYQQRREQYLAANEHTLFLGYGSIIRQFAFRVKQPVDHPLMYRNDPVPD